MERRHFFISRAGEDEQFARFLAQELSAAGYSYYEQGQWLAGDDFVHEMGAAIDACEYTLGLFTPLYWDKQYTSAEWRAAWNQQKLIGVMVDACRVDTILQSQIFIDLTKARTSQEKGDLFLDEIGKRIYALPIHEGGWRPPLQSRRVRRKPAAGLLPYLCDREKQEPAMLDSLAAFDGKPVVLVVGAEDEHRPEKVRERLAHVTIQSYFEGREPYVQPKFIAWPTTLDPKEFRQQLERAKKEHNLCGLAPEDVIVVGTDVVIERSSEKAIAGLLREYIRFWRGTSAGQGCLFVVCLSISYRSPSLMRWFHLGRAAN
ncbi:MAG TPA: toll/interleukin-1 receptor domain-containing protein, partial [Thermoanaerobaculia bacterium]